MRYALFLKNVDSFRRDVQKACNRAHVRGTPWWIICPFKHYSGKWVIAMPKEPVILRGDEIVSTVERPVIAEPILEKVSK